MDQTVIPDHILSPANVHTYIKYITAPYQIAIHQRTIVFVRFRFSRPSSSNWPSSHFFFWPGTKIILSPPLPEQCLKMRSGFEFSHGYFRTLLLLELSIGGDNNKLTQRAHLRCKKFIRISSSPPATKVPAVSSTFPPEDDEKRESDRPTTKTCCFVAGMGTEKIGQFSSFIVWEQRSDGRKNRADLSCPSTYVYANQFFHRYHPISNCLAMQEKTRL